jgi:hypothetical protein
MDGSPFDTNEFFKVSIAIDYRELYLICSFLMKNHQERGEIVALFNIFIVQKSQFAEIPDLATVLIYLAKMWQNLSKMIASYVKCAVCETSFG